jgi:hypothetical protein
MGDGRRGAGDTVAECPLLTGHLVVAALVKIIVHQVIISST